MKQSARRTWLILLALAFLPFLLRIQMDFDSVQREAVLSLYQEWRWSPGVRDLRSGSPLIFERMKEKSAWEEAFKNQLQQDFKLVEVGSVPRVRAFFDAGTFLRTRVEIQENNRWIPWQSGVRFVNNGILLGAWVALLMWILGRSKSSCVLVAGLLMLLWQVDGNILDLPGHVVSYFYTFFRELILRQHFHDWTATDMGRLPDVGATLWIFVAMTASLFFGRIKNLKQVALLGFLLEPFVLWTSSLFGHWGSDAIWWKIYLGSFAFRFVTLAHLWLAVLRPHTLVTESTALSERKSRLWMLNGFLPMTFLISGGWAWLNCVVNAGAGDTLLRLKIFFIGFLMAFILGSRIFSLWLGLLVLAVIFPPSKGHLVAASWSGLMMDGLLLGWWLTPLKGYLPLLDEPTKMARFSVITFLAWMIGVFLSSVGAPLGIVWVMLILAVWAYAQLSASVASSELVKAGAL